MTDTSQDAYMPFCKHVERNSSYIRIVKKSETQIYAQHTSFRSLKLFEIVKRERERAKIDGFSVYFLTCFLSLDFGRIILATVCLPSCVDWTCRVSLVLSLSTTVWFPVRWITRLHVRAVCMWVNIRHCFADDMMTCDRWQSYQMTTTLYGMFELCVLYIYYLWNYIYIIYTIYFLCYVATKQSISRRLSLFTSQRFTIFPTYFTRRTVWALLDPKYFLNFSHFTNNPSPHFLPSHILQRVEIFKVRIKRIC